MSSWTPEVEGVLPSAAGVWGQEGAWGQAGAGSFNLLGAMQALPLPLLQAHIWARLPLASRRALRATNRALRDWVTRELMADLQIQVHADVLQQLVERRTKLHCIFPAVRSMQLAHAAPLDKRALTQPSSHIAYMLTELGVCHSMDRLRLAGWWVHACTRTYP